MNFRVTTRFTWLDSTIRSGWLRKEKRIWREKRKERRRSGQDTGNKKKFSRNVRQNKKTQGWISEEDTQEYQWYHEYFTWKPEREHELRKEELKLRKQEIENQTQQIQNAPLAEQDQLSMLQQQDSLMMDMFQKFCWPLNQKLNYSSAVDKKRRLFSDFACLWVVVTLFEKPRKKSVSEFF